MTCPSPLIQIDVIEENVRLYDCMTFSEKQFIIEVSMILIVVHVVVYLGCSC